MRGRWLNLILKLTNLAYSKKQEVLKSEGFKTVFLVIQVILLEFFLLLISLPIYLVIKSSKATSYIEKKSKYKKVVIDYKVRRVLSLSAVGVIFCIWIIKFVFIFTTSYFHEPLQLYKISNLQPIEMNQKDILEDAEIETLETELSLTSPTIEKVEKNKGYDYIFYGSGTPGESIVLFLTDFETVIYKEDIDKSGRWKITHSQKNLKLKEGVHSVFAFSIDKNSGFRSKLSSKQYFRVKHPFAESLTLSMDNLLNWAVGIIILIGIFITILTI